MTFTPEYVYNVRNVNSFREIYYQSLELFGNKTAFTFRNGDSVEEISYTRACEEIRALAVYLNSKGYENTKIAVTGKNSYTWAISYFAIGCGSGIIVPLDKDLSQEQCEFILSDAGCSAVIVSGELEEKFESINVCEKLYMKNFPEYIAKGKELIAGGNTSFEDHKVDERALGILLYTSGTTGVAKGVMLSQFNICQDLVQVLKMFRLDETDTCLSVLPLHHTYECTAGLVAMFFVGATIAYNNSLRQLHADLSLFRPTIFLAVPAILEKFKNIILDKYSSITGGNIVLSVQKAIAKVSSTPMKKKIFSTINNTFGGRLTRILCGAAPLAPDTFMLYEAFGIRILIGYGLTETSPVTLMHNDGYRSPFDTGYPVVGTSAKIVDPNEEGIGELAVKGPHVMLGYYNNPEATADVLRDGWFFTGDLAKVQPNGAISIVGRTKSMIVSPSGKKIFPEELEHHIEKCKFVAECMVFAVDKDGEPVVTASIFPRVEKLEEHFEKQGIKEGTPEFTAAVKTLFTEEIKSVNNNFPAYKAIKKVVIRTREFEKTTTQKIKRNSADNLSCDD